MVRFLILAGAAAIGCGGRTGGVLAGVRFAGLPLADLPFADLAFDLAFASVAGLALASLAFAGCAFARFVLAGPAFARFVLTGFARLALGVFDLLTERALLVGRLPEREDFEGFVAVLARVVRLFPARLAIRRSI